MKTSEKAALAMAGYTKAEIEAMDNPAQPAPAAVQNPAIPQHVPPLAAQPAKQIALQPAPQPAPQPETPDTGDSSMTVLWIALLFVSGATLMGTTLYSRKKRVNNH